MNRRSFLRLSATAGAGALLAACDGGVPTVAIQPSAPPSSPVPAPTSAPSAPPVQVALASGDAEVWGWQRAVSGTLPGDCAEAYLLVGDAKLPLTRQGEAFSASVQLGEGQNEVVVVCSQADGQEQRSEVKTFTVPLTRRPTAVAAVSIEGQQIVLDGGASRPAETGGAQIAQHLWSFRADNPAVLEVPDAAQEGGAITGARIGLVPPTVDGEYYVTLKVIDQEGREDTGGTYFAVENGTPRIPNYDTENPAWVERAVIYGVVPRKFGDPAFQGIIDKLGDLQDLGVDALWLAPINRSPAGDYGYAVIDYFDVNPDFGTKDDFKRLVSEAHAHGIRVLMDFVPNHSSAEHPYFLDAAERGQESPYYDFYDRDESGKPTHYFDWEHLPNLNYNNPEVERFMLEAFSYWVREFDVDGFRVDVAWGVTERKPEFWPIWRRELKRIKPDLLLLAEATAREPFYFDNGYDAAYDWTGALGKWAWELVWDSKSLLIYNLNSALTNNNQGFHPDALIFRFLNNNDTGTRFITDHGEELTRVATALLLTLPGLPCIYTGDEVGAWFRPYYDELPMTWDATKYPGLLEYHKQLIALRHELPSLHSRHWLPLELETAEQIYAYLRYVDENTDPTLVLLNFGEVEQEIAVTLPDAFAGLAAGGSLRDRLSDETLAVTPGAPLAITMPAWGAKILRSE